jgi:tagatose-6-phosphate ketose/aldose isomerase
VNPLLALLDLSDHEKRERGLVHTPREIMQQPASWQVTFDGLRSRLPEIRDFLNSSGLRDEPGKRPIVFLIGAGTSDYIGHSLHHLLRRQWQCEVIPVSSPDLLMGFTDYILPQQLYLWISFSRSGDSPESVAVLERALADCPAVRHIVVSCNAAGRMTRSVDGQKKGLAIVLDEATNDRGLAMTSSFSNMLLAGQILAHAWSVEAYEPICGALSEAGESFMLRSADIAAELADGGYARACFVGSGLLAGAGMESALKLLELTAGNVQAFSESTLALRHGPMSALDQHTLFVSFVSSQEQQRKYELDLLNEIRDKSLVRTCVAVATTGISALEGRADYIVSPERVFDVPDLYRPILDVIFGQLLGLFTSVHFGLKPDSPSPNGAISRVVQNVEIYQ